MSTLVDEILSHGQNEIGDLEGNTISEGEWISMFNDVHRDIGMETRSYLARYTSSTNPDTNIFVIPKVDTAGNRLSPYMIHRVVIDSIDSEVGKETKQFSLQAVARQAEGNQPFDNITGKLHSGNFGVWINENDERVLSFASTFNGTETITVDFIQYTSFDLDIWRGLNLSIPDYMVNAFKTGIVMKAHERLFYQGNYYSMNKTDRAAKKYREELHKAAAHARWIKDENSSPAALPINWLPE